MPCAEFFPTEATFSMNREGYTKAKILRPLSNLFPGVENLVEAEHRAL